MYQANILYLAKLTLKCEVNMKTFTDIQERKAIPTRLNSPKMPKEIFHNERSDTNWNPQ